jgi:hypothetical protein
MPGKSHQEPSTEAACVDSSERECHIFETVNLQFVDEGDVNDWMANSALADVLKRGSFEIF